MYCTTTSLQTVMIGTNFDTVTSALASECILWAEAEVNKYLSKRYDLTSSYFQTTSSTPPMVSTWAKWLAQGYMYQQMGRGGKEAMERGKSYIDRALENLKLVQSYEMDVVNSLGSALPESATGGFRVKCNTIDYPNTFNEDDELNWQVSSTKEAAIDSEREE